MAERFQGSTDVDLDEVGVAQASSAAARLAALRPDLVVASDLRRARDTAGALVRLTQAPLRLDAGLREVSGGRWEGLTRDEIVARWPAEHAAWRQGPDDVAPVGGETRGQVADRAAPVVLRALEDVPPGGTLVVTSHGGTSRSLLGHLLGLPVALWGVLGGLSNCHWSVLEEAPRGFRLLEHNAGTLPEPVLGDDAA